MAINYEVTHIIIRGRSLSINIGSVEMKLVTLVVSYSKPLSVECDNGSRKRQYKVAELLNRPKIERFQAGWYWKRSTLSIRWVYLKPAHIWYLSSYIREHGHRIFIHDTPYKYVYRRFCMYSDLRIGSLSIIVKPKRDGFFWMKNTQINKCYRSEAQIKPYLWVAAIMIVR